MQQTTSHQIRPLPPCPIHRVQDPRQSPAPRSRCTCRAEEQPGVEKPDFIERAVGALFGRKALQAAEPFGMKRMSDEAYAEQSVATLTELAAPVAGDSEDVRLFRPLLAKT